MAPVEPPAAGRAEVEDIVRSRRYLFSRSLVGEVLLPAAAYFARLLLGVTPPYKAVTRASLSVSAGLVCGVSRADQIRA